MRERHFLGTYRCAVCDRRVRVYDWLGASVLCSLCDAKIQAEEQAASGVEGEDGGR